MLSTTERETKHRPTDKEIQKLLRILGAASVATGSVTMDNVSAHIEPALKSSYTDSLLSKISILDISQQIATPNPASSREFSLSEKLNSVDLAWTAGTSGQLYRYSKDGLAMLTALTGGASAFSDLGAPDTSCYLIISEGQISSNLNCRIKSSRTGISPDISIKRILNTVTLGLTRHGNADDSQLFILGTTQDTVPVSGSLNEITVNTSSQVFCGVLIAAQSTSSVACAIDLLQVSGLTPTPGKSETLTPTALKTSTSAATNTPNISPTPSKTETVTPTRTPETEQYYTQILDRMGVKIKGGAQVNSQYLQQAGNIITDMISYNADFRTRLVNVQASTSLFPQTGKLIDLPEFRGLRGQPAPGGGLIDDMKLVFWVVDGHPIAAITDEYAQIYPGGIRHEFASAFMHVFTIAETNEWNTIFSSAKNRGIYPGTYAMQNASEYWSELSRSYLGLGNDEYGGPAVIRIQDSTAAARLSSTYGPR